MGTYNRSPLNRLAYGSVSHATVPLALCSKLLLKGESFVSTIWPVWEQPIHEIPQKGIIQI